MATTSINLIVPQGWHELGDKQLRYVYSLIAKEFSADEIKTLALLYFSGCKVIARHDKNSFLLKLGKDVFKTSGTLIAEVIPSLGWLDAIPASPVRLKKLRNHASVDAEFQGVPFYRSTMAVRMTANDKVAILGFGTFAVQEKGARTGINPRTKEKIEIPARKAIKFKAGADLDAKVK